METADLAQAGREWERTPHLRQEESTECRTAHHRHANAPPFPPLERARAYDAITQKGFLSS